MSSSHRSLVGPSLPPAATSAQQWEFRGSSSDHSGSDEEFVGPHLPVAGLQQEYDATQAFLEREQRRNQAAESAKAAEELASSSRPDWMLAPPTASSLSSLVGDPLALKSRGFAQSSRVRSRGGGGAPGEIDSTLWTETPAAKEQRLKEEQDGRRARATDTGSMNEDKRLQLELDRARDAQMREAIRAKDPSRSRSLLEIHQADRRKIVHDSDRDDCRPHERKRSRHRDREEVKHRSSGSDSKRHKGNSERRADRSDSTKSSKSSRKDGHQSSKHTRPRSGKSEETKTSNRREKRDPPPPTMWDREAALSIGGKLMDEKARNKTLQDAAGLADRFGSGSRSFL